MQFRVFIQCAEENDKEMGEIIVNAAHISRAYPTPTGRTCLYFGQEDSYIFVREAFAEVRDWLLGILPD